MIKEDTLKNLDGINPNMKYSPAYQCGLFWNRSSGEGLPTQGLSLHYLPFGASSFCRDGPHDPAGLP